MDARFRRLCAVFADGRCLIAEGYEPDDRLRLDLLALRQDGTIPPVLAEESVPLEEIAALWRGHEAAGAADGSGAARRVGRLLADAAAARASDVVFEQGRDACKVFATRREGRVFAVTDEDGDGRGERVREVASGLRMPSGVAFDDGALYVAAVSTILRFDEIESRLDDPPAPVIVTDRLPSEGHHGWKVLEFGPDGLLYLPVGAPCDVCRTEGYHGTILRMRRDGSGIEIYARGLRNSVGLAWHPETGGAVVHRQRQRSPGPRPAARRVEQGSGSRPPLRVPVLPCRHAARSRVRRRRTLRRYRAACPGLGGACGAARPGHPFRNQCAASVSGRGVHRGTRTRKPEGDDRLPGICRAPRRRPQDRVGLRGICPGMVRQRAGVGTAGRHPGRHPTALSWSRTIGPGESTGSNTSVGRRPPIPPNARPGPDKVAAVAGP